MKEPDGRLARWFLTLQLYDVEVTHKAGNSVVMRGPDTLSRYPTVLLMDEEETNATEMRQKIIVEQNQDPELGPIKTFLNDHISNSVSSDRLRIISERAFLTEDGMLISYVGDKGRPWEEESFYWKKWIPQSVRNDLLKTFHEEPIAGHLGVRKTYFRMETRFYWYGMRSDVGKFIKGCVKCQACKHIPIRSVPASSLLPTRDPGILFQSISWAHILERLVKMKVCLWSQICSVSTWKCLL
jgi:hypothetical protein